MTPLILSEAADVSRSESPAYDLSTVQPWHFSEKPPASTGRSSPARPPLDPTPLRRLGGKTPTGLRRELLSHFLHVLPLVPRGKAPTGSRRELLFPFLRFLTRHHSIASVAGPLGQWDDCCRWSTFPPVIRFASFRGWKSLCITNSLACPHAARYDSGVGRWVMVTLRPPQLR